MRLLSYLRRWRRAAEFTLARKFGLATPEDRAFLVLIAATGILAGFLGVAVHRLIDSLQTLLWGSSDLLGRALALPPERVILALLVGGVLVGLVILAGREHVAGPGMSLLVESVVLRGGGVPARPVLWSSLAAIATVGSGGSLGREGPMIRLGAMLSSRLAQRFRQPPHRVKILLGCGAAAGLAAAYNIPIGGAVFAMEVILGNFALQIFGPIVAASVLSTLIARTFEGDVHRFAAPGFSLETGWELFAYVGLGLVAGVASNAFVFGVRWIGGLLRRAPVPDALRPLVGMGLLGVLALEVPHVLEGGQEPTNRLLAGELPGLPGLDLSLPVLLLAIAGAKILATALTAGSGGVGGLFTPSLFFGALVGGAYGAAIHAVWPAATGAAGAYAAVGMAAIAAGTSHAPISAILILFEFTGNYDLILPLMAASITSSIVAHRIYPFSIYTEALQRRGIDLNLRMEEAVLARMGVRDLTREDPDVLAPASPFSAVVDRFFAAHRTRLFVVDGERRLLGEVSFHDIKHALDSPGMLTAVVAHDLLRPADPVLPADARLDRAAEVFSRSDHERLPVVDDGDRFLGVVAKRDLLAVYAQEVLGRPAMLATFVAAEGDGDGRRDYVELPPDFAVRLVDLPPNLAGQTLAQARLPQVLGVRVIEVKRGDERVIPGGETLFEPGDKLIVLGPLEALEELERGRVEISEAEAIRVID